MNYALLTILTTSAFLELCLTPLQMYEREVEYRKI